MSRCLCVRPRPRLCGVRGRPSLVWGRAARAAHGCGCRFADQYITYEHGAPPSCGLSVHTSESTASVAQLALPPATAAHGLTATLAWQRVAELNVYAQKTWQTDYRPANYALCKKEGPHLGVACQLHAHLALDTAEVVLVVEIAEAVALCQPDVELPPLTPLPGKAELAGELSGHLGYWLLTLDVTLSDTLLSDTLHFQIREIRPCLHTVLPAKMLVTFPVFLFPE